MTISNTRVISGYDITKFRKEKYHISTTKTIIDYNILFNNPEISFINGLLHVNTIESKAILFTNNNELDQYYLLKEISSILNHISINDFSVLNINELLKKINRAKYSNISDYTTSKISTIFKTKNIEFLYKLHDSKIINVQTISRNITLGNFKNNLSESITQLFESILDYENHSLDDLIDYYYYSIFRDDYDGLNLAYNDIKALSHIKYQIDNNPEIYDSKLAEFENICNMFLRHNVDNDAVKSLKRYNKEETSSSDNIYYIKNSRSFIILLIINKYSRYDISLVFKFNNLNIPFDIDRYNRKITHFIIANLMYINEYENVLNYFKNKLLQSM